MRTLVAFLTLPERTPTAICNEDARPIITCDIYNHRTQPSDVGEKWVCMVKNWTELPELLRFHQWNTAANAQSLSHTNTVVLEVFRFWRWAHLDRGMMIGDVTSDHAQEYLSYRMSTPARNKRLPPHPETIRSIRNRLKVFADYLVVKGRIDTNPWISIKGPPREKRFIEPPSDVQIDEILRASGRVGRNPRQAARNKAITYFLVHTGVRCNELVRLTRENVEDLAGIIRTKAKVYGKGSKERLVGVNSPARAALASYFAERNDTSEAAFVDGDGYPITNTLVRALMHRIRDKMNKTSQDPLKHFGTHALRRWCFNRMVRAGVPLNVIKELGGWASYAAMEHYIYYGTVEVAAQKQSELILTHA